MFVHSNNNTANITQSIPLEDWARNCLACVFFTITLIGIVGNMTVILVFGCSRSLRVSSMNFILLVLASVDLITLCFCLPDIIQTLFFQQWRLGLSMCRVIRYTMMIAAFSSVMLQMAVCVERFIVITLPLKSKSLISVSRVRWCTLLLLAVAFAFASPYAAYKAIGRDGSCHDTTPFAFGIFEFLVLYVIPACVLTILYTKLCVKLWRTDQSKALKASSSIRLIEKSKKSGRFRLPKRRRNEEQPKSHVNKNYSAILIQRRKITKSLLACVLVYFVSYSPIQVLYILSLASVHPPTDMKTNLLLSAITYSSAAINPIIYTIYLPRFRSNVALFFKCTPEPPRGYEHTACA